MFKDILQKKWLQPLVVVLSCLLLNINTISHEYALDDEMVLNKNILVHKGIRGLPEIFSQDAYKSYFNYMGVDQLNLVGGRYRPLSIASFAIEQSIFGQTIGEDFMQSKERLQHLESWGGSSAEVQEEADRLKSLNNQLEKNALEIAGIRHACQIVYHAICCLCLFWFLRLTFGHIRYLPLIATLLFVFHPVHTEVVANVKSRDEIFSLAFILASCCCFVKYFRDSARTRYLIYGLLFYLLAFLSKEYAFTLMAIIPLIYLLQQKEKAVFSFLGKNWFLFLFAATAVFFLIRYSITKSPVAPTTEVLNDPYLYATVQQKAASIIATWIEYLRVLFYPFKLSSDYSYSTFPYRSFSDAKVWMSLAVWVTLAIVTIVLVFRRNLLALPLVWFFVFFVLINNLFFDIGATMGERLIFHSSVGFCILLAWLLLRSQSFFGERAVSSFVPFLLLLPILVAFAYKTISRNADWKNDFTLFTHDVITNPNSTMLNNNAGTHLFNKGHNLVGNKATLSESDKKLFGPYITKSLAFFNKAIEIHPDFINARINRALCYFYLDNLEKALVDWKAVKLLYAGRNPHLVKHAATLLSRGMEYGAKKDFENAVRMIEPASVLDPQNAIIWNNLGGAYYMNGDMKKAKDAFVKALEINPSLQDARNGLNAADYNLRMGGN
ncbi:tetratricopeptide repeat protein [Pedobacter sp. SYSU D00535]|uniref:tetratricopeptide repeat protein n=1 Tax=Pedobacter sp. SYSU D00535 TaxID=2810308 RepID=UPI001A964A67|nr:tetratricopeptide repeat protein [Pedobacter sp. SYSU D00535]